MRQRDKDVIVRRFFGIQRWSVKMLAVHYGVGEYAIEGILREHRKRSKAGR